MRPFHRLLAAAGAALALAGPAAAQMVQPPAALSIDGVPPVPEALRAATGPYMESRSAGFVGWDPKGGGILVATRFGATTQIHKVAMPGGARTQLTFEAEPISGASYAPGAGDVLLIDKDVGGSEFYQIYRLAEGRLQLLTDGKSRNEGEVWSRDGRLIGYSSTRRNGTDSDLYLMDPRQPGSDRMVLQRDASGWAFTDFSPDGRKAIVGRYISINESSLFELDLASGQLRPLTKPIKERVAYGDAKYGPDGTIYVTCDKGAEFLRLGKLGADGEFKALNPEPKWGVEFFAIADDGAFIAYVLNEAGASRLKLLDPKTGQVVGEPKLPAGIIGGLEIAPWGAVGFTLSSARSPADAYSVDPKTLALTRWTMSETGGLDPGRNVEPQLVAAKSFDGLEVSGFLYRPDPARFPGKRPLIVNIHGGPESQARAGFLGRNNYLVNELGIAILYPNVRGSDGYGKSFLMADNGPWRREDSVKDIGAFLDRMAADPAIDAGRIGVTGGSYGGYMTLASLIRYGDRLRAGIDTVGISNWVTFLENTEGYRRDLRRAEYGDEREPRQRAKLLEISPLARASELKKPLMVVTGANDPRVPKGEADQIVAAVRKAGGSAWHLLGRNEGHGFAKKENIDYNFWASLGFWRTNLLGEAGGATAAQPAP